MKISEFIEYLTQIQEEHGDMDVDYTHNTGNNNIDLEISTSQFIIVYDANTGEPSSILFNPYQYS